MTIKGLVSWKQSVSYFYIRKPGIKNIYSDRDRSVTLQVQGLPALVNLLPV